MLFIEEFNVFALKPLAYGILLADDAAVDAPLKLLLLEDSISLLKKHFVHLDFALLVVFSQNLLLFISVKWRLYFGDIHIAHDV